MTLTDLQHLQASGLNTIVQAVALAALHSREQANLTELNRSVGVSMASMSAVADRLTELCLAVEVPSPSRRERTLKITPKGKEVFL